MVSHSCSICHNEMLRGVDYTFATCKKKHLSISHTSCFQSIKPFCSECHRPLSKLTSKQIIRDKERQDDESCGSVGVALVLASFAILVFSAFAIGAAHSIGR